MVPFFIMLGINVTVLICWMLVAPLQYGRLDHLGTDAWNRIISTYGTCMGEKGKEREQDAFVGLLVAVNLTALFYANFQAYRARHLPTEYSESKYIITSVIVMTEAGVIAIPVLLLVKDKPQVFFVVQVLLIFIIAMAILYCIFVPKIFPPPAIHGVNKGSHPASAAQGGSSIFFSTNDTVGHIRRSCFEKNACDDDNKDNKSSNNSSAIRCENEEEEKEAPGPLDPSNENEDLVVENE
jgi:gamma-aminobutyric acid type B receptor